MHQDHARDYFPMLCEVFIDGHYFLGLALYHVVSPIPDETGHEFLFFDI